MADNEHEEDNNRTVPLKYDDRNNIIEIGVDSNKSYYLYDRDNKLIKSVFIYASATRSLLYKEIYLYKYDKENRLKEYFNYSNDSVYNANDDIINNDNLNFNINYLYDEQNRVIKEISWSIRDEDVYGKRYDTLSYSYDENIKKYCNTHFYSGIAETVEENDDKGNVIQTIVFDTSGAEIDSFVYKYEYDKKGNWIKKSTFANYSEVPYECIERKIEYYE
jgi:hypothetical protein